MEEMPCRGGNDQESRGRGRMSDGWWRGNEDSKGEGDGERGGGGGGGRGEDGGGSRGGGGGEQKWTTIVELGVHHDDKWKAPRAEASTILERSNKIPNKQKTNIFERR